ncbi:MAG: protein kinase [Gemmatimonadota bacterium]|nr:protein kinase [Gemmatimonadota bacterium]
MDHQRDKLNAALAGRYTLQRELGRGGMATVYLAEDLKHHRPVALKVLKPELAAALGLERFLREIEIAAQLQHPHILPLHDSGEADGLLYYVMPYVAGESLREHLRRHGPLPVPEVMGILRDVADALGHAHANDVVHRDIKPDNVMLSGRHAMVMDFGVAKAVSQARSDSPLTSAGISLGTPTYMAPEQIAADPAVDHRADLYALGVMTYELLAGSPPFAPETPQALLAAHLTVEPEPIAHRRPDVPPLLASVVMRCLEKRPDERWQHAEDILHGLRPFFTPGSGSTDVPVVRPRRRGRRVALGTVVVLVLTAIASWVGLRVGRSGGDAARVLAVVPLTIIGDDPATRAFGDGLVETMASRLTELTRAVVPPLWVIPPNEIRELEITSAAKARAELNATLAVTGSLRRTGDDLQLTLNLVEAASLRQLRSARIAAAMSDVVTWEEGVVAQALAMLEVQRRSGAPVAGRQGQTRVARAYELYVQARGYLQRHDRKVDDLANAIGLFEAAVAADSVYALAFAGLGEAYWLRYQLTGDTAWVPRAMGVSRRALALSDSLPDVWATLALIGNGMGRHEEALASAQRALALDPHHTAAQLSLASAYQSLRRLDEAETAFEALIAQQPYYWRAYNAFAFLRYVQGRYLDAAALFARAGELAPGNAAVYRNAGAIYFFLDRWDEAKAMFDRSVRAEPNASALSNVGAVEYFEGDYAAAAERFRQAIALKERDFLYWRNLGDAYRQLPSRQRDARQAYEKGVELALAEVQVNPSDPVTLSNLAFMYASLGRQDDARALLSRLSAMVGDDPDLMFTLAQIAAELGDRERAATWLVAALERDYSLKIILSEPQLAGVRQDARFQEAQRKRQSASR